MYPLILKDFLLLRKVLLLILGFIVFFLCLENPPSFAIALAGFIYISNSGSFDDVSRSDLMWNSLPIGRTKIVSTKYVTLLLFGLIAEVLVIGIQALLHFALNMYSEPFPDVSQLIAGFLAILIVAAIYFPISYKFGEKYGRILIVIVVLGTVVFGNIVMHFAGEKMGNILEFFGQFSQTQILGISAIVAIILFIGSWLLSLKIYQAKDF